MLVFGSVLLTACGEETENAGAAEYSVLLLDEDRQTILYAGTVEKGATLSDIETPTKAADEANTYSFAGWVDENGDSVLLAFINKDIIAYASYTATQVDYSLSIFSNEQEIYSYEKVKVLRDGTYLTTGSVVHYGDELTIEVVGSNGYSHEDGDISYQGLDMVEGESGTYYVVRGDVTISFTETANVYTVRFLDSDGSELHSTMVSYGSSVEYPYSAPTKADDDTGSYTFSGWVDSTDDDADYVDLTRITGTTTVYAKYNITYIEYLLTIDTNADVVVYKNGTAVSSGQTVHYGDILTIEANANEGYEISTLQANGSNITGNALTVRGATTITCTQTICTYSVVLYDDDKQTVLYSSVVEWNSNAVVTKTPTKDSDVKYSYSFSGWVDVSGKSISSTLIIYNVKADITGYAHYAEEYVPYTLTLSDYVTVTLDDGTEVSNVNASSVVLNYDQTFTVTSFAVPEGYDYHSVDVQNATSVSSGYSVTGNVTVTVYISKSFVADKYQDLQEFAGFANAGGEILYASSLCTQKDGFMFYTYVGTDEIELSASYSNFLEMEIVDYVVGNYDSSVLSDESQRSANFVQSKATWTSNSSLLYQDYITTPLYQGMEIEFTITYSSATDTIFGISTYSDLTNAASHVWGGSSPTSDTRALYLSTYGIFSSATADTVQYLYQTGSRGYFENTSFANTTGGTYTIRLVLGTYLQIYIDDVLLDNKICDSSGIVLWDTTSIWELSADTPYYFSIAAAAASKVSVTFTSFGYTDTLESVYVSSLSSSNSITLLGDSITAGSGATSSSYRYSTVLAKDLLGITELNKGTSGAVYCTGSTRTCKLDEVDDISMASDFVVVLLGINDYNSSTSSWATLGTYGSTDTTTIYGAINAMYSALVERFDGTDTKIYVCTPSPTQTYASGTNSTCTGGYTMPQLVTAIKTVVADYEDIVLIDLFNEVDFDSNEDYKDDLHPNDVGHAKIANYIYSQICEDNKYDYILQKYGY